MNKKQTVLVYGEVETKEMKKWENNFYLYRVKNEYAKDICFLHNEKLDFKDGKVYFLPLNVGGKNQYANFYLNKDLAIMSKDEFLACGGYSLKDEDIVWMVDTMAGLKDKDVPF